ncbi:MAG TPA: FAD-dependent oxidoreductase [Pseudonocardia sp.]|nr:FAD-dependent oxidoreductase [Pseudonocardia sp.]
MSAHVVVVGAGYAGVSAAKRLRRGNAQVTVVNPRADFVERIRLHQLMVGNHTATRPLESLLPKGTGLVQDAATSIDADRRTVTLAGGDRLDYDYLVYAAGSRSGLDVIPGAREHAVTVGDLDDAVSARVRLSRLPRGASVTVVGAGLTGVEAASEIAELGAHTVRLVSDGVLAPSVGDKGRDYLRGYFADLGVEVVEQAAVTEVTPEKIVLADGRALDSDLTVVTALFELPTLAGDSGLAVDHRGALLAGDTLVSASSPTIIGAGDAVRVGDHPLRMSCQAAIPIGAHAAETVLHLIAGTDPKPVRARFTGQCISLGRRSGLIQLASSDDVPRSSTVRGRTAAFVKEQVCLSTMRVGLNPRFRLSYSWS